MATIKQRKSLGNVTISSDIWKMVQALMRVSGETKPLGIVSDCVKKEYMRLMQQKTG